MQRIKIIKNKKTIKTIKNKTKKTIKKQCKINSKKIKKRVLQLRIKDPKLKSFKLNFVFVLYR